MWKFWPVLQTIDLDNFRVADKALMGDIGEWGELLHADICRDELPEEPFDWVIHAAGIASPFIIAHIRLRPLKLRR